MHDCLVGRIKCPRGPHAARGL